MSNESKYTDNIQTVLKNKDSFIELFRWKNGYGDKISENKEKVVLGFWNKIGVMRELKIEFSWTLFQNEFEPQKNSNIWKIFLLHLIDPSTFPIFDQHVYRSYNFIKNGVIEEIPTKPKIRFEVYKLEYRDWFNNIQKEYKIEPKELDKSFFSFGKMLKGLKKYPIQIYS